MKSVARIYNKEIFLDEESGVIYLMPDSRPLNTQELTQIENTGKLRWNSVKEREKTFTLVGGIDAEWFQKWKEERESYRKNWFNSLTSGFRFDSGFYSLILSNAITMGLAIWQSWSLPEIMLIYWFQSVVIGVTTFIGLVQLKPEDYNNSRSTMKVNGRVVTDPAEKRKFNIGFFPVHYGGFHAGYLMMIMDEANRMMGAISYSYVAVSTLLFTGNHIFSYFSDRKNILAKNSRNPDKLFFAPYVRIIPMHLVMIVAGQVGVESALSIAFFMGLKTMADVMSHLIAHSDSGKSD